MLKKFIASEMKNSKFCSDINAPQKIVLPNKSPSKYIAAYKNKKSAQELLVIGSRIPCADFVCFKAEMTTLDYKKVIFLVF